MEGKCFFCLFLVFHGASERGRKELGTVRLLCFGGGGDSEKCGVPKLYPLPPKKMLYMKIVQPPWQ